MWHFFFLFFFYFPAKQTNKLTKFLGPHCRKHQPSDLNFANLSSTQPRETGEKRHHLARTKHKRKDRSWMEMSDVFWHYPSHNRYEQDQSLFFLHVQPKGCLRYLGHVGWVTWVKGWILRAACLTGQVSHQSAQTPASCRLVSEPGARWSVRLETGGPVLPRQSAYMQPFWGWSGAVSPPAIAALMEPGQCHR